MQTPGIVPIHDHGQTEEGTFFFVMDLLDGVSLADVLQVVVDGRVRLSAEDWSAGLGIATHERTWLQQLVAWMAQLADTATACRVGVYLHGLAGDLAAARHSPTAMIASDLADHLGDAVLGLHQKNPAGPLRWMA